MKKSLTLTIAATGFLLAACGEENNNGDNNTSVNEANNQNNVNEVENNEANEETNDEEDNNEEADADGDLHVTASFSVLADIVEQVGGDRVTVDYIVPRGEEPEEHEPTPSDFEAVTDSEAFFINGMGLESWLESMMENVADTPSVELSDGVEGIPLEDSDAYDPHAWLNPENVSTYVDNLVEELTSLDPEGEEAYQENAEAFKEELTELDSWIEETLADVPEENRFLTISEDALVYFGERYDFETAGIWELNAHEEGTPQQISSLVDHLTEQEVPYVFIESTVNPNYMETVSDNSGVPIYEEMLYTDAIGEDDTGILTYIDMMEHNVEAFADALGEE